MADFVMPALGADMDAGTLLEWLVKPGDQVHRGDVIAVVDTDKAAIEVESFADGTVQALIVDPGQTVPVGTVLATITEAAAPADTPRPAQVPGPGPPQPGSPLVRHLAGDRGVDLAAVHGTGRGGTITRADVERAARPARPRPPRSSPRARRVAAELSIDLAGVTGTGPAGAITESDVRRAAKPAQATAKPERLAAMAKPDRLAAMRQATARLMARSNREIPHYYLTATVDLARAMAWLHDRNRELEVTDRLVPAALLLKAAAVAASKVRELNGFWADDNFVPGSGVNLGIAISLRGGGLVTPAIHDADSLGAAELMQRLRDLVARARGGRLRGSELTGATITVTNLGDQGVESVHGVIYPPQVALVGFGKIAERPMAVGGLIGARPSVIATLAADHRATDGYTGARYLNTLSDLLQEPEEL